MPHSKLRTAVEVRFGKRVPRLEYNSTKGKDGSGRNNRRQWKYRLIRLHGLSSPSSRMHLASTQRGSPEPRSTRRAVRLRRMKQVKQMPRALMAQSNPSGQASGE